VTYEYPDNEDEIIEGIKLAINAFDSTVGILNTINQKTK